MKVVVSLGGSVLVPDLDPDRVRGHATVIEDLAADHAVCVVTGGGRVARQYIEAGRELGGNEMELDQLGIAVTRLNARLLVVALGDRAAPTPPQNTEAAKTALRRGDVPVMGGTVPGHTTDAVSAALAEHVDADLLVYATSVDGVYSADPRADDGAERYPQLSAGELVEVISGIEMSAGASTPVDLLAAKLIERSDMRAIVLDGSNPAHIVDAVLEGEHTGTDILPGVGAVRPPLWDQE